MKIRVEDQEKAEVIKEIEKLDPEDKKALKVALDAVNEENKKEYDKFMSELKKTKTPSERKRITKKHDKVIKRLTHKQENNMMDLISELIQAERAQYLGDKYITEEEAKAQERENVEKKIEKELQKISDVQITKKEIKKAKEEAIKIKRLSIKDQWIKIFNKISFHNEVPGEILFHVFIGQIFKNVKVLDAGGKPIKLKIDFFWIQNSSSGKGEAVDNFLKPMIDKFGEKSKIQRFKYSSFRGQSSMAGMLNQYKRDTKNKSKNAVYTNELVIGPLQRSDFWIWTEANDLINPNKYSMQLIDGLMDIMEGKEYEAYLAKYQQGVVTRSAGSLIGTSRPIEGLDHYFFKNGFVNRCLTYMKNLSNTELEEMSQSNIRRSFGEITTDTDVSLEMDNFIRDANKIYTWARKYEKIRYPQKNPKKLNSYLEERIFSLQREVQKDIKIPEIKTILFEYINRIRDKIIKLAYHNAIIRQKPIDLQDLEGAFDLISKCFNNLKFWTLDNYISNKKFIGIDSKIYENIYRYLNKKKYDTDNEALKRKLTFQERLRFETASQTEILNELLKDNTLKFSKSHLRKKIRECIENNKDTYECLNPENTKNKIYRLIKS